MKVNDEDLAQGPLQTDAVNLSEQKLVYKGKEEELSNIDVQIREE